MIEFFLSRAGSFLTIGLSILGASLLRAAAQIHAEKGDE